MYDLIFRITLDDYLAFVDNHQSRARYSWLRPLVLWSIVLANAVVVFVNVVRAVNGTRYWTATIPNLLIVLLILWAIYVFPLWVRKRHFKKLKLGKSEIHFIADDDKIAANQAGVVTQAKWSALEDISSTPTMMFVWMTSVQAFFVPKSAFATPEEAEKFYQFAKGKIETSSTDAK